MAQRKLRRVKPGASVNTEVEQLVVQTIEARSVDIVHNLNKKHAEAMEAATLAYTRELGVIREARDSFSAQCELLRSTLAQDRELIAQLRRENTVLHDRVEDLLTSRRDLLRTHLKQTPETDNIIRSELKRAIDLLSATDFVQEVSGDMPVMITEWYDTLVKLADFPRTTEVVEEEEAPEGVTRWGADKW